jgi:hypothetical protein
MAGITIDQFAIFALIATPILFALIAYPTRAAPRRVAGALVGGLGFGVGNALWDLIAYYAGWWHYPFTTTPYAPWSL